MCSLSRMTTVAVIVLTLALVNSGQCFKCYKGIQGATTEETCDSLVKTCMKMDFRYIDQRLIVYSCSDSDNPDEGCNTIADDSGSLITCYCKAELCNNSCLKALSAPLLFAVLFRVLFFQ
ncbi:uncharacterized protein [Palaemon carinicauda]|uniref:uncharacterized protein n=1 Tax=Palaemon carinicauda TaxID=392227 RepID=UPI0035B64C78